MLCLETMQFKIFESFEEFPKTFVKTSYSRGSLSTSAQIIWKITQEVPKNLPDTHWSRILPGKHSPQSFLNVYIFLKLKRILEMSYELFHHYRQCCYLQLSGHPTFGRTRELGSILFVM